MLLDMNLMNENEDITETSEELVADAVSQSEANQENELMESNEAGNLDENSEASETEKNEESEDEAETVISTAAMHDEYDPDQPHWYVIHTYSGYENKVKRTLQQIVENRDLHNFIFEIEVPEEEVVEIKEGKKKTLNRKIFPGYVLIKMRMNDDIWYIVRNVQGVTGFVGPNSKPVPLRDDELAMMGVETDWVPDVDYEVGDSVKIINGPLESFIGLVEEVNYEKKKVLLSVSMFGRETPVELDFTQVMSL